MTRRVRCAAILLVAVTAPACAHRSVVVPDAELVRVETELWNRGSAEVTTADGARTRVDANEIVATSSGEEVPAKFWSTANRDLSAPSGGVVRRIDVGASILRGVEGAGLLALGTAFAGGVTCAVGAICEDHETQKLAGIATLVGAGVLVAVSLTMFALCKSCWVTAR